MWKQKLGKSKCARESAPRAKPTTGWGGFFLLGFVLLLHVETNVVFVWLGTATTK